MTHKNITSAANALFRQILAVASDRRVRRERGECIVEGPRMLDAVRDIRSVVVRAGTRIPGSLAGRPVITLTPQLFSRLSDTEHSQGILVVAGCSVRGVAALDPARPVVLLDGIQDPGNLGAIARCAAAFGFDMALTGPCADPFAPRAVRASAGLIAGLLVAELRDPAVLAGRPFILCESSGQACDTVDWQAGGVIAIGSEAHGFSPGVRALASASVGVPMAQRVDSLNAAVAAGIVMFSFFRRGR